jgi:hypothetical protein
LAPARWRHFFFWVGSEAANSREQSSSSLQDIGKVHLLTRPCPRRTIIKKETFARPEPADAVLIRSATACHRTDFHYIRVTD